MKELNETPAKPGFIREIIDALLEQPIELAKNLVSYLQPQPGPLDAQGLVMGNERWEKVRFVVTKIDELYNRKDANARLEEQQVRSPLLSNISVSH